MKRAFLIFRSVLELLVGIVFVAVAMIEIIQNTLRAGTIAYKLGELFGSSLLALLGILLVRHAYQVGRRLRTRLSQ